MAELQSVVINSVVSVLVVLISVVFSGIRDYIIAKSTALKTKKTAQEFDMLQKIVSVGVNAVEQLAKSGVIGTKEKFDKAIELTLAETQRRGLHVTRTQISPIIESFVKEMNDLKATLVKT